MSLFNYTKETEYGTETNGPKVVLHVIVGSILAIVGLILLFGSWTVVNSGEAAVVLRMGKIDRTLGEGFNWITPFIENVETYDITTQKEEVDASAASKDMQIVTTTVALNYELVGSEVDLLRRELGHGKIYKTKIIDPAIQEVVKAVTAKYTAEELVTQRESVRVDMKDLLSIKLSTRHIHVSDVSIVNFNFSEQFNRAIEAKVTAEQQALEQKNKLEQVKYEAQQKIETAKAEAEKTRLEVEALKLGSDLIEKIKAEAQLKAAEKWDGRLPVNMYGSAPIPLIDIK